MIKKIDYRLKTTEVDALALLIVNMYKEMNLEADSNLGNITTRIYSMQTELNNAVKRVKTVSWLNEYRNILNKKTLSLFHLVGGYMWHPDESICKNATVIKKVLNKYGANMVHTNNATQESLTQSLLTDLSTPQYSDALEKLYGCTGLVSDITIAYNNLREQYIAYKQKVSTESSMTSATKLAKQLREYINSTFIVYVNAMAIVDADRYGFFARTVAQMINNANDTVARRYSMRNSDKEQ